MTEIPVTDQSSESNPSDSSPCEPTPAFGWTAYAERINGRFAMMGFLSLLVLNFLTQQDFFTWIGLR